VEGEAVDRVLCDGCHIRRTYRERTSDARGIFSVPAYHCLDLTVARRHGNRPNAARLRSLDGLALAHAPGPADWRRMLAGLMVVRHLCDRSRFKADRSALVSPPAISPLQPAWIGCQLPVSRAAFTAPPGNLG
jgi:hypothetical protein